MSDATLAMEAPGEEKPKRAFAWSSLARIEAKHLAGSVFLIVGVLAAFVLTLRDFGVRGLGLDPTWPTVPADTTDAWHMAEGLAPFALLAGAWLALRDKRSGARDLVSATPTSQPSLTLTRLASLIAVSAISFAVLFAAGLVASLIRGGHGAPDLRLLLDGGLGVAFAAVLGYAIGTSTRSMVASLFAAPLYGFAIFYLDYYKIRDDFHLSFQWLSPAPQPPIERSVVLGWLPDILWLHILFLAGVVLAIAVLLAIAPTIRRGSRDRSLLVWAPFVAVAIVVTSLAGSSLVRKPDGYVPTGPRVADWRPVYSWNGLIGGLFIDPVNNVQPFAYPDDHRATSCASVSGFRACVYPAYGNKLAMQLAEALSPQAALVGDLPGVPHALRMVPVQYISCTQFGGAVLFGEGGASALVSPYGSGLNGLLVNCAFPPAKAEGVFHAGPALPASQQAVELWVSMRIGAINPQDAEQALSQPMGSDCFGGGATSPGANSPTPPATPPSNCTPVVNLGTTGDWLPDAVRAALRLDVMPVNQAHALITRYWNQIRAGSFPVSQLTNPT